MTFGKLWLLAGAALASLAAISDDHPPPDGPSMRQIVEKLEQHGYGPFVEVSFDDGVWEVELYKGDVSLELNLDANSGEILSEHRDDAEPRPPKGALALSALLKKLEDAGYSGMEEASFERRYWEVEAFRGSVKHEIHVDPKSGDVVADREDD